MSLERAIFRAAMEADPPDPPAPMLKLIQVGPCHCGCGRPAGILIEFGCVRVFADKPGLADAIAGQLVAARERIWGPRNV